MSQDESSMRRQLVKRTGKRFTVDMRKELDSLITDCYGDDIEESSDSTLAPLDSTTPPIETPGDTDIQSSPNNIPAAIDTQRDQISHTQQEPTPPTTQLSPDSTLPPQNTPAKPTRKLVYSHSQSKLTLPSISSDGNGRSSNPIPVDANYGKSKQETITKSDDDTLQSGDAPLPIDNLDPIKKTRILPDLKVDLQTVPEKKQASTSVPSSPVSSLSTLDLKNRRSLFFDNVATKVARALIITTNTVNGPQGPYTVYVMEAYSETGQVIQNVSKRFKNFSELVEKLKERAPEVASMMPHRVILGNMTARLVSHRKVQLQALLDYILSHRELSRSVEVLAFFRNPTLLKQLASKPDMEGYLNRGLYGTLGMKYIQMWASLKSPCLYFWQSYSETAELKSAVVLRWLTVDIADEVTFTIELRPWQHLLFPSDHQSRPISIRAASHDEMIYWARALHVAKAAVNDIIMLKKTMLQEEDATSEMDLGDDEEDIISPRQDPSKVPPLTLSASFDSVTSKPPINTLMSHSMEIPASQPLLSPRRPSLTSSDSQKGNSVSAPSSPRTNTDSPHRYRNQTQAPAAQAPPKMVTRSQTESQLTLPRKTPESPLFAPSSPSSDSSLSIARHSTPVAKLKDFVEKPDSQPLSRFEARMAMMGGPPKYPREN